MFMTLAFLAIAGLGWFALRTENKERQSSSLFDDDQVRQSIMFAREDIRLVAYLLAAVLVMLGVIADKV